MSRAGGGVAGPAAGMMGATGARVAGGATVVAVVAGLGGAVVVGAGGGGGGGAAVVVVAGSVLVVVEELDVDVDELDDVDELLVDACFRRSAAARAPCSPEPPAQAADASMETGTRAARPARSIRCARMGTAQHNPPGKGRIWPGKCAGRPEKPPPARQGFPTREQSRRP